MDLCTLSKNFYYDDIKLYRYCCTLEQNIGFCVLFIQFYYLKKIVGLNKALCAVVKL